MERRFLGIDVGGTGIKYALMDDQGKILDQSEVPTPMTSLDDYIQALVNIYHHYENEPIEAVVGSAPGRIDANTGYFYTGGSLTYVHEVNLKELLEKEIPVPVVFENDAKAAAQAELWQGSMKGVSNGIVMTIGTAIGGALILNGKLYRGSTHAAGEFSMIPVHWKNQDGFDVWAFIANTHALTDRLASQKGIDPAAFSGRDFFALHASGDEKAQKALEEFCAETARGMFGLQTILDVEKIAIGGGISRQPVLVDTLNEKMSELFTRLPSFNPASQPEICSCTFSSDANLIGALYHYLDLTDQL